MNNTSNTINMTIRIDKNLKKSVDKLFKNLGISTNSAINMFLKQCDREQRLIFTPSIAPTPSKKLLESLQEMEDYKKGKIQLNNFKTTKELFAYLDEWYEIVISLNFKYHTCFFTGFMIDYLMDVRKMLETILLIISVLIIALVLLQGSKASDAGQIITGGNETLFQNMKERGLELFISRLTLFLGIAFFIISLVLFLD